MPVAGRTKLQYHGRKTIRQYVFTLCSRCVEPLGKLTLRELCSPATRKTDRSFLVFLWIRLLFNNQGATL